MVIAVSPPLNSTVGVELLDFCAALIPSSLASMVILPPLILMYVPSMPSAALALIVPPSIVTVVIAWIPSSPAVTFSVPPFI